MSRIKVLAVAPYEAMKTTIERLGKSRPDIELTVRVADLSYGKELLQRLIEDDSYDVIISRGGTAQLIEEITDVPVVEISLSVYDILRAIKLAENYKERYAIMGFPNITGSAYMLCDLLQYQVDIFTVHSAGQVRPQLEKLKKQGYQMVVCDVISHREAKALGLNAILITSGAESIEDAFNLAVKISKNQVEVRRENAFLKNVLKSAAEYTVIFGPEGNVYFSTWDKQNETNVFDPLRREIPNLRTAESYKVFRSIQNTLFSIVGSLQTYDDQPYAVFHFTQSQIPITPGKYGIRYASKKEARDQFVNSFYSIPGILGDLAESVEKISQSPFPVMITGETGTGKELIALLLYIRSALDTNPLIIIDCRQLTDKGWTYLTNHYSSPLNDSRNTIYFHSIDALGPEKSRQLLSCILDTNLHRRNRLIFSCVSKRDAVLPPEGQEIVKQLSCLTVCVPPLRERVHELPTLSSIYLSALNVELGKQLIGFEPKAMEMFMQYDWPQNYTQFGRLTAELAVLTNTPYITSNAVASLLDKERASVQCHVPAGTGVGLNLDRPLDEIVRDVIKKALAKNQGNQSQTAKQLQISRTTLWRYLKE